MKKYMVLVGAMMMIAGMVSAQEVEGFESAEIADSLIANVDTVEVDPDPEWYVAPLNYDSVMARRNAPRRAAAAGCVIDSILTFDIDSNLVAVTMYEYGDTTRTMTWAVNPDGSRVGQSRTEEATTPSGSYTASYEWDDVANDWKGTTKTEYVYESGNMISNTTMDWLNGDWTAKTSLTYAYNENGKQIEYITWARDANNQLVPTKGIFTIWYNTTLKSQEITYTKYSDGAWSAGTKKIYGYDDAGNQVLYEYYSSYKNGVWNGSVKEISEYTSGKRTLYITYSWSNGSWVESAKNEYAYNSAGKQILWVQYQWSNGDWVGSLKETWSFNAANLQTLHEKFTYTNNDWLITLREIKGYDDKNNNTLVENYSYTNGVANGTKKEEYGYNAAKKKTLTIKYKWSSSKWIYNSKSVNEFDAAGNTTEMASYLWKNEAWVGNGTRILQTFNSAKKVTEKITQTWPTGATDWVNSSRQTTEYSGSKTTQEASYTWQDGVWVGISRSDWHYNAAGQNDTIKTYTPNGTEWTFSSRTVNTYDSHGNTTLSVQATWDGADWVPTLINRGTYTYTPSNKPLLIETYSGLEGAWVGQEKKEYSYNEAGQETVYHDYAWLNGEWVNNSLTEHAYDDAGHTILDQSFKWSGGTWVGTSKKEFAFDAAGRSTMQAIYIWITNWRGISKSESIYDTDGNPVTSISYGWNNDDWIELTREDRVYDNQKRVIEYIKQIWSNENWINDTKETYGFDSKGQNISTHKYSWDDNKWIYTSLNDKWYDESDNKLRREITGSWSNGVVTSYIDKLYYYNIDFPLHTIRFENYDGSLLQSKELRETKTPVYEGAKPSRPATAQYTYSFKGWTPAIVAVTGDATYTAEYDSVVNRYRITWLDADNAEVAVDSLAYGVMPSHEDVVKPSTSEWAYLFAGWSPAITTVTGDATYKAQLDSVRNGYRITWLDVDDTELAADSLSYGAMPSHEYVLKANTAEWTYSFVGWIPEIVSVTADATYKAQIDSVRNRYRVTWLDADDTELAVDSLAYGATPSREYVLKANTAEWTYSFVGWTPEIVAVTGDATYKAQIDSVRNRYRITWLDTDDTEIAVDSLAYGAMPSHEYVLKANTAEWTYSFVGWTPEIVAVIGDATYKAQIDSVRNSYRIVWFDTDDTELAVDSLAYGATPSREYVLKANTAEWTYSFVGWTPEIATVTGNATYKAQIDSVRNRYRITWLDADDTEIAVDSLAYGATPSREYVLKANTAEWTYSFVGWTPEIAAVSADATYKAQIDSVRNSYLITFKNGVDTLQSTLAAYGTMPVYGGEAPTKQADAQYTYSFNGWDAEIAAVTGETTYNATFSSTVNNYTITWLLDDGTKIDEQSVAYGTTPSHTDAHKDNTAQYTITFVGWDKAFAAVTGDETYTAVFDSVVNRYTVIFYFEDGVTVLDSKEFEYGEMPSTSLIPSLPATAKYTYTFEGWSPELQPVTGNAAYTPVFDSIVNTYTVTFVNYNDMVLQSSQVPYDDVPEYTGETPIKPSNVMYHYVFTGWTPELVAVTGDARYKAVYDQVLNRYTILFYDEDGLTILDSVEVEYGEMPETSVVPTKEDDEEYTYTFAGWSPKIVSATKNTSYTATYTATRKTEGLWDVEAAEKAQKVMIDGVIYIRRGGKIYTLDGTEVE